MYIPDEAIENVIEMHYDLPVAGHLGITRIIKLVQQRYNTLALRKHIKDYIS